MEYYGDRPEDSTIRLYFNTFSSDDPAASATITNLADADIKVHKDGGTTQIATDGATIAIDFDSITGNHIATIDTSAHSDYSTGSEYSARIEGTTIDGGTINAWIGSFHIEMAGGVLALAKGATGFAAIDTVVDAILADTNELQSDDVPGLIATLDAVVDTVKAETVSILADTNELQSDDVPGLIATLDGVVDAIGVIVTAIQTDTNELQSDDVPGLIATLDAVVDTVKAETVSILADTNELQSDDIPGLIATLDAVVDTVKAETVLILADTAELGAAVGASISADIAAVKTTADAIPTTAMRGTDDAATEAKQDVIDGIVDAVLALLDDARGEPGQGAPSANPDAMTKIDYLYKAWRNKATQTATTHSLFNDAGSTVDQKATISDDGTTFTDGEKVSGP